jgi:hypothetical protein
MGTLMSSCWRQEGLRRPEENDSQGASFARYLSLCLPLPLSPSLALSLSPSLCLPLCEMTRVLLLCNILKICRSSLGVVQRQLCFTLCQMLAGRGCKASGCFHFYGSHWLDFLFFRNLRVRN